MVRLCTLLMCLAEACLTVNLAKCEFNKATVIYLGKEVGQGEVHSIQANILPIQFSSTINKEGGDAFLGMVGYYQGFCPNILTVVSPMTDLLKNSVRCVWSEKCQKPFKICT